MRASACCCWRAPPELQRSGRAVVRNEVGEEDALGPGQRTETAFGDLFQEPLDLRPICFMNGGRIDGAPTGESIVDRGGRRRHSPFECARRPLQPLYVQVSP